MGAIRVLLADDHAVLRDSLRAFLGMYPDLEVVGEASDGVETLAQAMALRPDILLLDMAMPNLGGLEVLRRIRKDLPDCKVVVLTQHEVPAYILPALQAGAKGYLLKKAGGSEVVQAVRAVARGESVLHPGVAKYVIEAAVHRIAQRPVPNADPHPPEGDVGAVTGDPGLIDQLLDLRPAHRGDGHSRLHSFTHQGSFHGPREAPSGDSRSSLV